MSTILAQLPIIAGGIGASVSTENLGAKKTLIVTGVTGTVDIEASYDGINFCSVATFAAKGSTDQFVEVAAPFMRVNASNGGAATACVLGESGRVLAGVIPSPPGNGPGAALDVSSFGSLTTVFVTGIGGKTSINIEISCDGVTWSPDFKSFTADGCITKDISARFIRAVGHKGSAVIGVSSQNGVPANSGTTMITWAPEDPAGDRGSIFTAPGLAGFKAAYEACKVAQINQPIVTLYLDPRYSSVLDGNGLPTNEIPSSEAEPGGFWEMNGIAIDGGERTSLSSFAGASISFADKAKFSSVDSTITFSFMFGQVYNDHPTNIPLLPPSGFGICSKSSNAPRFRGATVATAAPLIQSPAGSPFNFLCAGAAFFTIGPDRAPLPAPIWDLNGIFCLIGADNGSAIVADNAFIDSAGGGAIRFQGLCKTGRRLEGQGTHPALGEVGVGSDILWTGWNPATMQVGPSGFFYPPSPLITAAETQMTHNNWRHWDTTVGNLKAFMPLANPATGMQCSISNAMGANDVELEPFGGAGTGNVRNVGGVDDVIDVPTVPAGKTYTYRCDGGNGVGNGVGRWTKIAG
jgi:hypothetical protein